MNRALVIAMFNQQQQQQQQQQQHHHSPLLTVRMLVETFGADVRYGDGLVLMLAARRQHHAALTLTETTTTVLEPTMVVEPETTTRTPTTRTLEEEDEDDGEPTVVEYLLRREPTLIDCWDHALLRKGLASGNLPWVHFLLRHGANVNRADILALAMQAGNARTWRLLVDQPSLTESTVLPLLPQLVFARRLDWLRALLQRFPTRTMMMACVETILLLLAAAGGVEFASALVHRNLTLTALLDATLKDLLYRREEVSLWQRAY